MRQQFFRLIADLRFSMCLLLVIAFSSIIGTVIEQNQSIETYKLLYPLNNLSQADISNHSPEG